MVLVTLPVRAGESDRDLAVLPAVPIVTGAGGVYAEWTGGDASKGGNVITAGSQALLDEALAVLSD